MMKFSARLLLSIFLLVPISALWATPNEENDLKQNIPAKPVVPHHYEPIEEDETAACITIQDLPAEVIEHILSFIQINDFNALISTHPLFARAALNHRGPFGDLFNYKKTFFNHYKNFKAASEASLFSSFAMFLGHVRAQASLLSKRRYEEHYAFAASLVTPLKKNVTTFQDNPQISSFKSILASLALVRAWDSKLSSENLIWFENKIKKLHGSLEFLENLLFYDDKAWPLPFTGGANNIAQQFLECLILNSSTSDLTHYIQSYYTTTDTTRLPLFVPELLHRSKKSALTVFNIARRYHTVNDNLALQIYDLALNAGYNYSVMNSRLEQINFEQAAQFYSDVLANNPDLDAKHYANAAIVFCVLEIWERGAHYHSEALKKNPGLNGKTYCHAGHCYTMLRNWAQAAEYYQIAFEKDPNLEAYNYANAALCSLKLENWAQAAEYYQIAFEKDPNLEAYNYANAALCFLELENWAQAGHYYQIAFDKDPNQRDLPLY